MASPTLAGYYGYQLGHTGERDIRAIIDRIPEPAMWYISEWSGRHPFGDWLLEHGLIEIREAASQHFPPRYKPTAVGHVVRAYYDAQDRPASK